MNLGSEVYDTIKNQEKLKYEIMKQQEQLK